MKRTIVLWVAMTLLLSACIPALPSLQQPTLAPVIDAQATDSAMAATLVAETLNALPTPTLEPATDTPTPTATETESPSPTSTLTETPTPEPNTEVTVTATSAAAIATETLHPRFFGTLPPALPSGKVTLVNKAKVEVYVSLQCTTQDGNTTVIEYPVYGRQKVSAPAGKYKYVAWVGGREFLGAFSLSKGEDLSITFNKDKVTIK